MSTLDTLLHRPRVWSIAASDCSGGAGAQADLAMIHALNVDCVTLISAITAQNSVGVQNHYSLPVEQLEQQWQSSLIDGLPSAIKLGWLPPSEEFRTWLLARLSEVACPIIWDPVKQASGDGLPTPDDDLFWRDLLPLITVITPNLVEARWLIADEQASLQHAITALHAFGVETVCITGGDDVNDKAVLTYVSHQAETLRSEEPECQVLPQFAIKQTRFAWQAHGSGCHFSAALAANIANQQRRYDAILFAAIYAQAAFQNASYRGSGYHNCFAINQLPSIDAWPEVIPLSSSMANAVKSSPKVDSLGLYVLCSELSHLEQLLALGVDAVQWRVKDPTADFIAQTLTAMQLCRDANTRFIINDYWQLAIELGADGVHLGQEDCVTADWQAIRNAGLITGISTHTEWEIAHARGYQPSYIAFGPVYKPLSKTLRYPPLGCEQIAVWQQRYGSERALTCIGGITGGQVADVAATGITSIAIVTALLPGPMQVEQHCAMRQHYPRP